MLCQPPGLRVIFKNSSMSTRISKMHVYHPYHFKQFTLTLSKHIMKSYGISIKDISWEPENTVVKRVGYGDKQSMV